MTEKEKSEHDLIYYFLMNDVIQRDLVEAVDASKVARKSFIYSFDRSRFQKIFL